HVPRPGAARAAARQAARRGPGGRRAHRAGGAPGGAGGTPALPPRGAVYASERGARPALARRLAPQPHVAPAARSDRRERGRGRAGARRRPGPPSRRDPAARRPRADRARARASRGTGDRMRAAVVGRRGAPRALAPGLRLLAAADQRRPLAQAGRARAMQYFSDDAVAERTLACWKELLGGT